eukprot:CAMPEP_0172483020 /NCGR_PEP_ID=MMETSP1066-20121228/9800_1 /TAXON_ID=671091 /ORGANISM="Coscinodiscus wailesii, Strain CCMP2513" /LENGTH=66 /DNA_ID=CAMNT_0013246641 /DNA_START=204 /DNA_END=404 /DNA_ORIENTATION=-
MTKGGPPPNFDPTMFDMFDDGGQGRWSKDINNPIVAAEYVKKKEEEEEEQKMTENYAKDDGDPSEE